MAVPGRTARNPAVYDPNARVRETNPAMRPVALQPYNRWDKAHDYEGSGGMDHVTMLKISYADYSKRPARQQIDQSQVKVLQAPEGCNEYNMWYDRYIGEQWSSRKEMIAAEMRCSVRKDAGRTKADDRHGDAAYCCIFFARGCCVNGAECNFLHRVPRPADDKNLSPVKDVFGRDRHATDKDDMRGTGNFNRTNKTLYVGGVKMIRGPEATHKSLLRHFSEWGHVDQLRLIPSKAIAFVTYTHRACAEFALEAMHCQTLDCDDLLNIRWSYDDPNPRAQQLAKEALEEQFRAKMSEAGLTKIEGAEFDYPHDYEAPAAKRQKGEDGEAVSAYPDTDHQYGGYEGGEEYAYAAHSHQDLAFTGEAHEAYGVGGGEVGPQGPTSREAAEREEARRLARESQAKLARLLDQFDTKGSTAGDGRAEEAHQGAAAAAAAASSSSSASQPMRRKPPPPPPRPKGPRTWQGVVDGESGTTYYYCVQTGETCWELPHGAVLEEDAKGGAQVSAEEYAAHYGCSLAEARAYLDRWYAGGGEEAQGEAQKEGDGGGEGAAEGGEGGEDEDLAALMDEAEGAEEAGG